jgi:monosaccharide-transporting ATPase
LPNTLLELRGIVKTFPGVRALDGVDFTLGRGEVHALLGENGAGKSTLIKVLTGVYRRDGGTMRLDGKLIDPRSPLDAQHHGISTVYQEVNLIPELSVMENLSIGREPRRMRLIDWRTIRRRADEALDRLGLKLDVTLPVRSYSIAIQQMVAIARALDNDAKVLVLDEPTSSLDSAEVEQLFAVMRRLSPRRMTEAGRSTYTPCGIALVHC